MNYEQWERAATNEALAVSMMLEEYATYEPIYDEMLADLKTRGYKVRFTHYRYPALFFNDDCMEKSYHFQFKDAYEYSRRKGWRMYPPIRQWCGQGYTIRPFLLPSTKGGNTRCAVSISEFDTAFFFAKCSLDDNFCYREGRYQALKLAYEALTG